METDTQKLRKLNVLPGNHRSFTTNERQPWMDSHDYYFEYLIIHFDYLIIQFDYLIIG